MQNFLHRVHNVRSMRIERSLHVRSMHAATIWNNLELFFPKLSQFPDFGHVLTHVHTEMAGQETLSRRHKAPF
jgi:hypothetical protein